MHAIVGKREGVELAARLAYGRQERLSASAPCVCVSVDQTVKNGPPPGRPYCVWVSVDEASGPLCLTGTSFVSLSPVSLTVSLTPQDSTCTAFQRERETYAI